MNSETYTFEMRGAYDSWNRVLNITYPDSEVVHYDYDAAGQLQSMYGVKDQQTVPIIDFIGYDAMGSRSRIEYGNGTFTDYTYDGYRQRLSQLKTTSGTKQFMDLHYSYDKENNILGIENIAAAVNGLGGVYKNEYSYDDMYRLTNANGTFTDKDSTSFPFTLEMSYTATGNIATKNVTADILSADNTVSQVAYQGNYSYTPGKPHAIEYINGTDIDQAFTWDLNGNLSTHTDNIKSLNRYLCWDEENRLMAVKDNNYLSAYVYDAAGERVWKLTGEVTQMKISGVGTIDVANLSNKTLYVSPYVVYNQQGYSKHYYAGAERVSSRIGGGTMYGLQDPITDTVSPITDEYSELSTRLWEMLERSFTDCLDLMTEYITYEPQLESVQASASQNNAENNWYIYHSDHLGSSSFLTDASGTPTQHLQYLPFGENYIEQRVTTDYYTPYTFSAKERDLETGYSYFGARYYDPNVSVWLSVDPMAGKFPGWTPYRYGLNNPLNHIDHKGNIEWPLAGTTAVNKRDTKDGGWSLKNTVVRTSTYLDTNRPPKSSNPHCGIDYRAKTGTTFYSLGDGKVTAIGNSTAGGNYITVEYANGDQVTFRHIEGTIDGLAVGSNVLEGQPLGTTGSTGTKDAHLHIDAKDSNGNRINPENRNYGSVTNEEFFNRFGGDYLKLAEYKKQKQQMDSDIRKGFVSPTIAKPDATGVDPAYPASQMEIQE